MEVPKGAEKSILLVSARSLTRHGVQTTILDIVRVSPAGHDFTWYCPGKEDESFAEEVRQEGVTVETGGLDLFCSDQKTQYRTIVRDIWRLCHEKRYDIIHVNTGILKFQAIVLLTAMLCGVPKRIAHSHNCIPFEAAGALSRLKRFVLEKTLCFAATQVVASSREVARALCGEKRAKKALVFRNRIDTEKFSFSCEKRDTLRRELSLNGSLVIGHVGVLNKQKNHQFLLEVFREVASKDSRAKLLLVGNGQLEKRIRLQVKQYCLEQKVIFAGYTDHASEYLCAMDVFAFPSLYEGMARAPIEAQISGLPCVVSDRVPPEVKLTEDVYFLPLDGGAEAWAEKLLSVTPRSDAERADSWKAVRDAGYDLRDMGRYVEQLYDE